VEKIPHTVVAGYESQLRIPTHGNQQPVLADNVNNIWLVNDYLWLVAVNG
jgi:hypothetical protein